MPTITCSVSIETAWQWVSKFKCGPKSTLISTTFEAFDEWKTVKQKIFDYWENGIQFEPTETIIFMFDGFIIEDEATPYSLGIEDGDVIEAFAGEPSSSSDLDRLKVLNLMLTLEFFLAWPRDYKCGKY